MVYTMPSMAILGIILLFVTIMVSIKSTKRFYKFLPPILVIVLAIIFCTVISIIHYYNTGRLGYIGIAYLGVGIIILPPIVLSVLVAAIFDIIRAFKEYARKGK